MEFLDGFKAVDPVGRVRKAGTKVVDFLARHPMLPAESDLSLVTHRPKDTGAVAVSNVVELPFGETITPDDAA